MGGLALKNAATRRYDVDEFLPVVEELKERLKPLYTRIGMPLYFRNKESFGDADFVVLTQVPTNDIKEYLHNELGANETFVNDNVISFDYKELQVDLIRVHNDKAFETTLMYLAYNDLGNMIGVIARGFGLKYGQDGLTYDHEFKGRNIGRIYVSTDYPRIYEFLGLDYGLFKKGFDDLEDIFKFVASSKYFDGSRYQFDKLNKINRDRNKKRKSYLSLLQWIEANAKDRVYEFEDDKSKYQDQIAEFFPESNLTMHIRRLEYEYCRSLYAKAKFNGGEVMRRYGLEGKALGDAMTGFAANRTDIMYGYPSMEDYILSKNVEDIYHDFENYLRIKNIDYGTKEV